MVVKDWNIKELCGYHPVTTFYTDFSIADAFGLSAVKDTYERAFEEWHSDVKFITELCMVMSWKSFQHDAEGHDKLRDWYVEKFYELRDWCSGNLKGADLDYFIQTID